MITIDSKTDIKQEIKKLNPKKSNQFIAFKVDDFDDDVEISEMIFETVDHFFTRTRKSISSWACNYNSTRNNPIKTRRSYETVYDGSYLELNFVVYEYHNKNKKYQINYKANTHYKETDKNVYDEKELLILDFSELYKNFTRRLKAQEKRTEKKNYRNKVAEFYDMYISGQLESIIGFNPSSYKSDKCIKYAISNTLNGIENEYHLLVVYFPVGNFKPINDEELFSIFIGDLKKIISFADLKKLLTTFTETGIIVKPTEKKS